MSFTAADNLTAQRLAGKERLVCQEFTAINSSLSLSLSKHLSEKMHHDNKIKTVGLCVVVAVSGCSVICAIIRLLALISLTTAPDDRWSLPVIPFVSALEGYVALMTSSIPAIYPLVVKPKFNFRAPMMANIEQPPSDSCWHSKSNTMTSSARQQSDTSRWNLKPVSARPSISLAVTGVVNDGSGLPETRSESNQRKASVVASRKVDDTIFMAI